jgi:ribose transport system ATP-binding protein
VNAAPLEPSGVMRDAPGVHRAPDAGVALAIRGLTKSFGAFRALDDVSLDVRDGEILGLIGENGAGKSTLLNIVCGVLQPEAGEVALYGAPHAPGSYRDAMDAGVFRVYQEPALIPTLTVEQNLVLGIEDRFSRFGFLRRRAIRAAVEEALSILGGLARPDQLSGHCDANTRQAIEIVTAVFASRALGIERPLILLDEPTAALVGEEMNVLFDVLARLRGSATFVFVTHRLKEIGEQCDRAYVLKDGKVVAEVDSVADERRLHSLMVGRDRVADYYAESGQGEQFGDVALHIDGLSGPRFRNVSFEVREGELVGIAGVVGSGKESLGEVLAGARARTAGRIVIGGVEQAHDRPWERRRARLAYVPLDRHADGMIGSFPLSWNVSLPSLGAPSLRHGPLIASKRERAVARLWIDRLGIRTRSEESLLSSLSGGNQQKTVIAKCLQSGARVLVLDNPTRGVDAGAKGEIYLILRSVAEEGIGMVIVSDDLLELIGLCNRVLVMKDGELRADIPAPVVAKPSEEHIVAEMV